MSDVKNIAKKIMMPGLMKKIKATVKNRDRAIALFDANGDKVVDMKDFKALVQSKVLTPKDKGAFRSCVDYINKLPPSRVKNKYGLKIEVGRRYVLEMIWMIGGPSIPKTIARVEKFVKNKAGKYEALVTVMKWNGGIFKATVLAKNKRVSVDNLLSMPSARPRNQFPHFYSAPACGPLEICGPRLFKGLESLMFRSSFPLSN